jgi:hypothetical protein
MEILQLLCSRRYCPANISQLNCHLNYTAISYQPPLKNSTDLVLELELLDTDHTENNNLLFLRAYSLPRERCYQAVAQKQVI